MKYLKKRLDKNIKICIIQIMKIKSRFKTAKEIREEKIEMLKALLAKGVDNNDVLSIHLGLSVTTVWKYRKMLDGKNFSAEI